MLAFCDPTSPERGTGHLRGSVILLGEESPERDTLLKALVSAGLMVSTKDLPALPEPEGEAAPSSESHPGAAAVSDLHLPAFRVAVEAAVHPGVELILIASAGLPTVLLGCSAARSAAPHAATLACLLAPKGRVPRVDPRIVRTVLKAGADDLLLGLPTAAMVLTRVLSALRLSAARRDGEQRSRHQAALRDIFDLLLGRAAPSAFAEASDGVPLPIRGRTRPTPIIVGAASAASLTSPAVISEVLSRIARAIAWSRADVVTLDSAERSGAPFIGDKIDPGGLRRVATSQEESGADGASPAPAPPRADPEVLAVLRTGTPTILEGARSRALLFPDRNAKESTVLVLPLPTPSNPDPLRAAPGSALVLLSDEPVAQLDRAQGDFLHVCTQALALALRRAARSDDDAAGPEASGGHEAVDLWHEHTRRLERPLPISERRREAVLQYREFFEASADGMMVLDGRGEVYYFNRAAEQITGYAAAGLLKRTILELVPEVQHRGLRRALQQAIDQASQLPFDLQVTSTSGEELTLSASTSAVLAEHGLAVLSFRDVTQQRYLEGELRKTKEFLERLIDSTVDGIIAADLFGNIMVFNQGAARITGYNADEVIGKRKVWTLYPPGEAQRIMAAMRVADHGGAGRISPTRRALVGKDGGAIPVSITASIIYEAGQEVATVGIFSDLRERLSIEQRLQQAQERLVQSERQALIAELAGAAAHELNQPLTSVMGYAGLLRRKAVDSATDLLDFVDIIVREAERMAEIVRKIGRITRYETKPYVGEARIIDLDRSTVPEPPPPDDLFLALSARRKDGP